MHSANGDRPHYFPGGVGGRVCGAPLPTGSTWPRATSANADGPTPAPQWVGIDPFGLWGNDKDDDPAAVVAAIAS